MTDPGAAQAVSPTWHANPLAPALALAAAAFLAQFDVTSVIVVMPAIASDLRLGKAGFAWTMDSYSLAFTGMLLVAGVLADRHGRRQALLGGNGLFALASLACCAAWDGPSLWTARAIQGAAAAFVITGGIASIAGTYPDPPGRARAFALMGVVSGAAMALGPTLGGLMGTWLGWRWIFLANLPACGVIAFVVPRIVQETRDGDSRPLDLPGVLLLTMTLGSVIEAFLQAERSLLAMLAGLAAGAGLGIAFLHQQRRQARPMLDPDVFAQPAMIGIAGLLLALSMSYWTLLVYLPLFLHGAFALSFGQTGLAMLAATLPMLVVPPMGSRLLARWGWRGLFARGMGIVTAGALVLAGSVSGLDGAVRFGAVLLGMGVIGIGAALVHPQLSGAVVALMPPSRAGMGSAVTVVLRQAGFAIGIAALGIALPADTADHFGGMFGAAAAAAILGAAAALMTLPPSTPAASP